MKINKLYKIGLCAVLLAVVVAAIYVITATGDYTADDIYFTSDGIYVNGELMTDERMSEIKSANFPTKEELKKQYPDKEIITWLLSTADIIDYVSEFRTDKVNQYLNKLGRDYVVCFVPLDDHNDPYISTLDELKKSGIEVDIYSPSYRLSDEPYENNYHRDSLLGILEPLDQFIVSSDYKEDFSKTMSAEYMNSLRVEGKIYGLSNTANNFICSVGYSVDEDLYRQYKWDSNKTIEEQMSILDRFSGENPNGCAVYCDNYGSVLYYPNRFDRWLGIYWDYEKDGVSRITNCNEYIERLSLLYALQEKGLLTYNAPVQCDSCFVFIGGTEYYGNDSDAYYQDIGNVRSKRIPIGMEFKTVGNIVSAISINADSKNKEKAFDLIMLSQQDKYLNNLLVFGVGNNINESNASRARRSVKNMINFYRFGNLAVCRPVGNYSSYINKDYKQICSSANIAPYAGFAFHADSVANEYAEIKSIMLNHDFMGYSCAEESIEALDKKLRDAGIDKVVDEINNQYIMWRETLK